MRILIFVVALALAGLVTSPVAAEVISRSENAFTLKFEGTTRLDPTEVADAFSEVEQWWDPAHSYTGDAANLSLALETGGCWCEVMPDGSRFDHGRVESVALGELRLHAPFGPLRAMATRADLVVTYALVNGVVRTTWTFVVEGPGVGAMADPVDGVMGGGFTRWTAHMDARASAL
ncbi:hypothetical protein [Brevundimonas sp.]|uniref:hypothetical protein n=1 Tax=Brevundimonas sp. TaxID=1871086 RepID=UPI001D60DCD4|nr:hypothetical protein [Brevundimonas sp.]MBL0948208.1 hypothetical protein [Brevundimonas sp.]